MLFRSFLVQFVFGKPGGHVGRHGTAAAIVDGQRRADHRVRSELAYRRDALSEATSSMTTKRDDYLL